VPLPPREPNRLVGEVQGEQLPRGPRRQEPAGLGEATGIPQLVVFAGLLGDVVRRQPADDEWRILYLDWALQNWLLIENRGIVNHANIQDPATQPVTRDVLWVDEDASVGRGSRSQSIEAQFLTGEFTRAGDFEAPPGGGTHDASTGVFCEARTPRCCYRLSRG
jgi:hypothetical protein